MKSSYRYNSGNLYKCPFQSKVYGSDNSDLIYRKSYQGDWGDWDDEPLNSTNNFTESDQDDYEINIDIKDCDVQNN